MALPNGGTLRIETNGLHLNEIREHGLDPTKNDNRILAHQYIGDWLVDVLVAGRARGGVIERPEHLRA